MHDSDESSIEAIVVPANLAVDGRARGSTVTSVNHLGRQIVTSQPGCRPGERIPLEAVSREAGVSRAMAREVLQVLHQKRLVSLQPRVGATVLPAEQWDVFDPDVIEWRLEVEPRFQIRSLTELRQAIEPTAASLAAERAPADVCRELVSLSQQLQDLGRNKAFEDDGPEGRDCRERYRAVDVGFHKALLKGSQNEMLHALADPVAKALNYRIEQDWAGASGPGPGTGGNTLFPLSPTPLALWLHRGLAAAVEQGHPPAAESFSRAILSEVRADPFPPLIGIAVEHALSLLGPRAMGAETAQFQDAIMAAVRDAAARPS